ncbi:MAG: DUF2934 domain-containing protein [Rhizobiaceae bacterium]|nr:DUF2934 domain-containing protein [Rhizobiaceae bacterium]
MPATKPAATPAIERIREIAYQLWLDAGQPDGTAEADWYAAETIASNENGPAKKARKAPARKKAA